MANLSFPVWFLFISLLWYEKISTLLGTSVYTSVYTPLHVACGSLQENLTYSFVQYDLATLDNDATFSL